MNILEQKISNQSETVADPITVLEKIENEIQNLTTVIKDQENNEILKQLILYQEQLNDIKRKLK